MKGLGPVATEATWCLQATGFILWLVLHVSLVFTIVLQLIEARLWPQDALVVFAVLLAANIVAYARIRGSDPGFAPVSRGCGDEELAGLIDDGPQCRVCGSVPTAEGGQLMHCRYCNRCVEGWDHHCHVLNTCVGARNALRFWQFLAVQSCVIMCGFHLTIMPMGHQEDPVEAAVSWVILVVQLLLFAFIGSMCAFHTFLAWVGSTSRDVLSLVLRRGAVRRDLEDKEELQRRLRHGGSLASGCHNVWRFCCGRKARLPWEPGAPPARVAMLIDCAETACDNRYYSCC